MEVLAIGPGEPAQLEETPAGGDSGNRDPLRSSRYQIPVDTAKAAVVQEASGRHADGFLKRVFEGSTAFADQTAKLRYRHIEAPRA